MSKENQVKVCHESIRKFLGWCEDKNIPADFKAVCQYADLQKQAV